MVGFLRWAVGSGKVVQQVGNVWFKTMPLPKGIDPEALKANIIFGTQNADNGRISHDLRIDLPLEFLLVRKLYSKSSRSLTIRNVGTTALARTARYTSG
jgi:hypothetical protein